MFRDELNLACVGPINNRDDVGISPACVFHSMRRLDGEKITVTIIRDCSVRGIHCMQPSAALTLRRCLSQN